MAGQFAPAKRTTLWIPNTGPVHDPSRGHLFICLTDPCKVGQNLLVPICSIHERCDKTCLVGIGDHPFLKHASFTFYGGLKLYPSAGLVESEKKGNVTYRGLLDERVFGFVCAGVDKSPFSPPKLKKYLAEQVAKKK